MSAFASTFLMTASAGSAASGDGEADAAAEAAPEAAPDAGAVLGALLVDGDADDEQAPTNKAAAIPIVRVLLNFTLYSSSVRVHTSPG